MKTTIEKVKQTADNENALIIGKVMIQIGGLTQLDKAYKETKKAIELTTYKCGMGGSHIWVSNFANERLMLITEK